MKNYRWLAALATGMLIAACGGGGGDSGSSPFGNGEDDDGPQAAGLALRLSSSSINNGGGQNVVATATATESGGRALAEIPVSFTVDNGATFTQPESATDANGQAIATVGIGSDPANRIITVRAVSGSLTASASFAVTGAALTGTAVPGVVVPSSTGNRVDFRLIDANGAAMAGQPITIDAGTLGSATGATGTNGEYSFSYTAPAAPGSIDITATAGGVSNTQTIVVSAATTVPPAVGPINSASVSANPSVVSVNTATTNNRTEIRALFVGPNNAPIRNVRVRFDLDGDANSVGGAFSTGSNVVYSDASGIATTAYIPAGRASPTNGVTIRACYSTIDFATGCPNMTRTTITVVSEPLSVTIGSNNVVINGPSNLTYIRQFVILVVDASGRAKANVDVVPSVDLLNYFKGEYFRLGNWVKAAFISGTPTAVAMPRPGCLNEDLNRNGVLEAAEDINLSGAIEPRKSDVAITIIGNGKTDANGSAVVQIEYPKNVSTWLEVKILVSATGVSGTEGRATWTEILPAPASDFTNPEAPSFIFSPYGVRIFDNSGRYPNQPGYQMSEVCTHAE